MKALNIFLLLALLGGAFSAIAQDRDPVTEQVLWKRVSLSKKLSPRITASVAPHLIAGDNITRISSLLTDFGLGYKINRNISLKGTYRMVLRFTEGEPMGSRHQLLMNLSTTHRITSGLKVYYRFRYQSQSPEMLDFVNEEGRNARNFIRNRIKVRYSINYYFRPWVNYELFHRMGHQSRGNHLRNDRLLLGLDYRINNDNKLNFFVGVQNRRDRNDRPARLIFGTTYSHSF